MNKYQNQNNLGEQFKNAVSDALNTGDFRELNLLVSDTLSDVISEAGRQVKNATDDVQKEFHNSSQTQNRYVYNSQSYNQRRQNQQAANRRTTYSPAPQRSSPPTVKNVGQVSSVLYKVFGGIGTGVTGSVLLGGAICAAIGFIWPMSIFALLVTLLGGSLLMIRKGVVEKHRLDRMKRYISLCAGKMYMNISDLAKHANKSTKFILKDIKKMLALGFFPEGHLDEKETCLMLDDATYREYLRVEKERKAYALEQSMNRTYPVPERSNVAQASNGQQGAGQFSNQANDQTATQATDSQSAKAASNNPELATMLREGHEYIRKLHELNDLIPGEVISEKMYRMESLLKEIFERVEEDPAQMPQMHKLMNYYLPTTIKLLQAYAEFDDISAPGPDIIAAKTEIEKTVDTINEAFTELLNKLFQATVFDVTTDAQVLQTMLAKEGLTKNDFSEDKK